MTSNKKKHSNDEIDLLEIIIIILANKTKIFIIMFFSLILMVGYLAIQKPIELMYEARTEIRPITTFDEFEYAVYNNFIQNTGSVILQYPIKMKNETFIVNEVSMDVDKAAFRIIDKKYLIDLFIQKIEEKDFLSKQIDNYGLINKKNFINDEEYNYAVKDLAEKFIILPNDIKGIKREKQYMLKDGWTINYTTNNVSKIKNFLSYVEKNINLEVRKYLEEYFKTSILSQQNIKKITIADMELEILNSKDENYIRRLEIEKKKLEQQKDIKGLQSSFSTTPIVKTDKFFAAQILKDKTRYTKISDTGPSKIAMIILSVIFGGLIGSLYVLISNAIQRRAN